METIIEGLKLGLVFIIIIIAIVILIRVFERLFRLLFPEAVSFIDKLVSKFIK